MDWPVNLCVERDLGYRLLTACWSRLSWFGTGADTKQAKDFTCQEGMRCTAVAKSEKLDLITPMTASENEKLLPLLATT